MRHFFHGVLTRGIQLERKADERAAYRVDDDCTDSAPINDLDGVRVSDGGAGDRATVLGFLPHLVLDIFAALVGGVLVDDREHSVQHAPSWRVIDVLLYRRDQPDAELLQGGDHDRVVEPVPGKTAEHVDDHVAHVGVFAQVGDHLLELGALVDACGSPARVDKLLGFGGIQFVATFVNFLALRRN
nr:hypothetical protein [Streptomyces sp. STR69]